MKVIEFPEPAVTVVYALVALMFAYVLVELAVLHLAELGFPVACHGRGGQGADVHVLEKLDETEALAGDVEFAAVAGEVFLAEEALDGGGAGGWHGVVHGRNPTNVATPPTNTWPRGPRESGLARNHAAHDKSGRGSVTRGFRPPPHPAAGNPAKSKPVSAG